MYKMIVVDNNRRELGYVREVLDWNRFHVEIVGLFANPAEALSAIPALLPNIILTDVVMPKLNGFQLVETALAQNPNLLTIFMSCHDDFSYAKMAVDHNACSYLLKPLIESELKEAVCKVVARLDQMAMEKLKNNSMNEMLEKSLSALQEQFFYALINGEFRHIDDIYKRVAELRLQHLQPTSICIVNMRFRRSKEAVSQNNFLLNEPSPAAYSLHYIKDCALSSFSFAGSIQMLAKSPDLLTFLLFFPISTDKTQLANEIGEAATKLIEYLCADRTLEMIVGISDFSDDYLQIPVLYTQSVKALEANFFAGINPMIWYHEIEKAPGNATYSDFFSMEAIAAQLRAIWPYGSHADVESFVDHVLTQNTAPDEYRVRSVSMILINLIETELMNHGLRITSLFGEESDILRKIFTFDKYFNIRQWLVNIIYEAMQFQKNESGNANRNIIDKIKAIVQECYAEPTTVSEIANKVFFSASYANSIFKEATGKTIFEYLTEYRIEKAMHLLKQPHCKVGILSEQVGYTNKSHFSLIFKKYVGFSPTDYRKHMLENPQERGSSHAHQAEPL